MEIGKLIVRLIGDGASYDNMLRSAQNRTKQVMANMEMQVSRMHAVAGAEIAKENRRAEADLAKIETQRKAALVKNDQAKVSAITKSYTQQEAKTQSEIVKTQANIDRHIRVGNYRQAFDEYEAYLKRQDAINAKYASLRQQRLIEHAKKEQEINDKAQKATESRVAKRDTRTGDIRSSLDSASEARRAAADQHNAAIMAQANEDMRRQAEALAVQGLGMVIDALVQVGKVSVDSFAKFETAMTAGIAITRDLSQGEIKQMEQAVFDISRKFALMPQTIAKGYYYLISAGFDAAQSMKLLEHTTAFAVAGNFDLGRAVTYSADAMIAMGMNVGTLEERQAALVRTTDLLVKANTLANANVQQFSQALTTKAAAALRATNKTMEEGVAILATYAEQGVKSAYAGNMLARLLILLSKSVHLAAYEHQKLGFAVYDSAGKMRPMADIIENLDTIMGDMSDEMKAATLAVLGFEQRTQAAILPLLGQAAKMRQFYKNLAGSMGTTAEVAKKMSNTFEANIGLLVNELEILKIALGGEIAKYLLGLAEYVKGFIKSINGLSPATKALIADFLMVVTTLIAVSTSIIALKFALIPLSPLFKLIAIGISSISGMSWPAITALGLLGVTLAAIAAVPLTLKIISHTSGLQDALIVAKQLNDELEKTRSRNLQEKVGKLKEDDPALEGKDFNKLISDYERQLATLSIQYQNDLQKITDAEVNKGMFDKSVDWISKAFGSAEDPLVENAQATKKQVDFIMAELDKLRKYKSSAKDEAKLKLDKTDNEATVKTLQLEKELREEILKLEKSGEEIKRDEMLESYIKMYEARVEKYKDEIRKLEDPNTTIDQKLEIQDKLKGKFDFRYGINAIDQVKSALNNADQLIRQKRIIKVTVDLEGLKKDLDVSAQTILLTDKQADVFKRLKEIGDLAQLKKNPVENIKAINAAIEALNAGIKLEKLDKLKKLFEESDKVIEDAKTPQEKYNDRLDTLDEMLQHHMITQETYNKAVKDAGKEFDITGDKAAKAMEKFDAAAGGSAEAITRIQQAMSRKGGDDVFNQFERKKKRKLDDLGKDEKDLLEELLRKRKEGEKFVPKAIKDINVLDDGAERNAFNEAVNKKNLLAMDKERLVIARQLAKQAVDLQKKGLADDRDEFEIDELEKLEKRLGLKPSKEIEAFRDLKANEQGVDNVKAFYKKELDKISKLIKEAEEMNDIQVIADLIKLKFNTKEMLNKQLKELEKFKQNIIDRPILDAIDNAVKKLQDVDNPDIKPDIQINNPVIAAKPIENKIENDNHDLEVDSVNLLKSINNSLVAIARKSNPSFGFAGIASV